MKPKYNIGDEVWLIDNDKIIKEKIQGVYLSDEMVYQYSVDQATNGEWAYWKNEDIFFPAKKALINHLQNE